MIKDKKLDTKLIKIYLITLINYVLILFLIQIYQLIRDYISGPLDWEFSLSMLLAGFVFGIFNLFNLVYLWIFIRNRYPTRLIILTLVELLYLPGIILLSLLGFDFLINLFYSIYLFFIVKFFQLVVALIISHNIRKTSTYKTQKNSFSERIKNYFSRKNIGGKK